MSRRSIWSGYGRGSGGGVHTGFCLKKKRQKRKLLECIN